MIPLIFAYINFTTLGTKMALGPVVQWEIMFNDLAKTQVKRIYRQNFKWNSSSRDIAGCLTLKLIFWLCSEG